MVLGSGGVSRISKITIGNTYYSVLAINRSTGPIRYVTSRRYISEVVTMSDMATKVEALRPEIDGRFAQIDERFDKIDGLIDRWFA
jgi:hypothetical protein